MSQITVDVSDEIREQVAVVASAHGHASVEDYVKSLIEDAAACADIDLGPPPGASMHTPEELKKLLKERLEDDNGSFEPDDAFYEELVEYGQRADERGAKA